jgi:anti-sigma regulatory factor (Ser/Thr protein kinase)
VASIELPPERSAAAAARRFVRAVASEWRLPTAVQADLELLVSELVTNAVLHARSTARLTLDRHGDRVRVTVADDSSVRPRLRNYGTDAVTGRGLVLVDRLAEEWGVDTRPDAAQDAGKQVWFELVIRSDHADTQAHR